MALTIEHVDLTPQQMATIAKLTPIRDKLIEQIKSFRGSRLTTKTYVRVGKGANQREWLVQRNGRPIPNPTPGRGSPRG